MSKPKQSLAEFAKANPTRRGATTWMEANLPPEVLEQVRDGWAHGLRQTTIERWLKAEGYEDATGSRVGSYFSSHPVEPAPPSE